MKLFSKSREFKLNMIQNGHTVTSLANKLDVEVSYVSAIANGKRAPSPVLAKRISDILDVKIVDIFEVRELEIAKEV